MQLQKSFQMPEVVRDEQNPFVIRYIPARILVLIESDQTTLAVQLRQYGPAVPAAAKSAVHVNTFWFDIQMRYNLIQQYRNMVIGAHYKRVFPFLSPTITDCASVLKSSGEYDSKNFLYFSRSQISILF